MRPSVTLWKESALACIASPSEQKPSLSGSLALSFFLLFVPEGCYLSPIPADPRDFSCQESADPRLSRFALGADSPSDATFKIMALWGIEEGQITQTSSALDDGPILMWKSKVYVKVPGSLFRIDLVLRFFRWRGGTDKT